MSRRHQQNSGGGILGTLFVGFVLLMIFSCAKSGPTSTSNSDVNDEYRRMEAREAQQAWEDRQTEYLRSIRTEMDRQDKRF
jgi:hypothetical protein